MQRARLGSKGGWFRDQKFQLVVWGGFTLQCRGFKLRGSGLRLL